MNEQKISYTRSSVQPVDRVFEYAQTYARARARNFCWEISHSAPPFDENTRKNKANKKKKNDLQLCEQERFYGIVIENIRTSSY